jgi:hypothetical protein
VPQELYYQHQNILLLCCRASFFSSNSAINSWIATHIRAERNGKFIHQIYNSQYQRNTKSLFGLCFNETYVLLSLYYRISQRFAPAFICTRTIISEIETNGFVRRRILSVTKWIYIAASGPEPNTKSVLIDSVINKMELIKSYIKSYKMKSLDSKKKIQLAY